MYSHIFIQKSPLEALPFSGTGLDGKKEPNLLPQVVPIPKRFTDPYRGLACCDSWGRKESDTTEWLNWLTDRPLSESFFYLKTKDTHI